MQNTATTLAAKEKRLESDQLQLQRDRKTYDEDMKEYNRIHNDQETEIKNRLKAHKDALTKKLNSQYAKKEKTLEKAYSDKSNRLWGFVGALSLTTLIPLIGIIVNVEENLADFQRFVTPLISLGDLAAQLSGIDIVGYAAIIVAAAALLFGIFALCKWFDDGYLYGKRYFCTALGLFEVLLVVNPILPREYNPFWIGLVLFIGGMLGIRYLKK